MHGQKKLCQKAVDLEGVVFHNFQIRVLSQLQGPDVIFVDQRIVHRVVFIAVLQNRMGKFAAFAQTKDPAQGPGRDISHDDLQGNHLELLDQHFPLIQDPFIVGGDPLVFQELKNFCGDLIVDDAFVLDHPAFGGVKTGGLILKIVDDIIRGIRGIDHLGFPLINLTGLFHA